MAMLDRYRRTGGFFQLLSLVEGCPPAKKEKFLELIRAESPEWADAVKTKMIDVNRIFSWSDETLAEIFGTLQDLNVAIVLHASSEEIRVRILSYMTLGRKRKIDDLFNSHQPSSAEIATMHMKMIETVRKMEHDGYLRFDKIDPDLYYGEEIEDELNKAAAGTNAVVAKGDHRVTNAIPNEAGDGSAALSSGPGEEGVAESRTAEVFALRKKMTEISKENAVLRHELSVAKTKLEQIKKIA